MKDYYNKRRNYSIPKEIISGEAVEHPEYSVLRREETRDDIIWNKRAAEYKSVISGYPFHMAALDDVVASFNRNSDNRLEKSCVYTWGPVLVSFTAWLLKEAAARGIRRLYFLSRDAWPLYRMAVILSGEKAQGDCDDKQKCGTGLELKYLRVSRYALRIPEIAVGREDFLDMIFLCGIDVNMYKILRRGDLTEDEMIRACRILGFDKPMDEILPRSEILEWKRKAHDHMDELYALFKPHADAAYETARGYLIQEGLGDDIRKAVVDSGWAGTTQRSLKKILGSELRGSLEGFYFGLFELPAGVDEREYHSWYFGPSGNIGRKAAFANCLMEAVMSEACGMVLGYRMKDGTYVAETAPTGNANMVFLQRILPVLENYARSYGKIVGKYGRSRGDEIPGEYDPELAESLLTMLMKDPSEWEAKVYGELLFSDDVLEQGSMQQVAAPLSYEDIKELRFWYRLLHLAGLRKDHVIHESGWIYGSIVNCGVNTAASIRAAMRYQRILYWRKSRK